MARGLAWSRVEASTSAPLYGVFGLDADHQWFVGASGTIVTRASGQLTLLQMHSNQSFSGIWASGPNDVWAIGEPDQTGSDGSAAAAHFNGETWTNVDADDSMFGIWGFSPNDFWAVGGTGVTAGEATHWTGEAPWQEPI
jgi:hypothetical protein